MPETSNRKISSSQSVPEILENINLITSEGKNVLNREVEKIIKLLSADFKKLLDVSVKYRRKIEKLKADWKIVKEEVEKLEARKGDLQKREMEVDSKIAQANKQEEELLGLHRILNNKKKALDAKERELREEKLKLHEKIVPPKVV